MFCSFAKFCSKTNFHGFIVKLLAMHCSSCELEILWEKIFAAMLRPAQSAKIFNLEYIRLPIVFCTAIQTNGPSLMAMICSTDSFSWF